MNPKYALLLLPLTAQADILVHPNNEAFFAARAVGTISCESGHTRPYKARLSIVLADESFMVTYKDPWTTVYGQHVVKVQGTGIDTANSPAHYLLVPGKNAKSTAFAATATGNPGTVSLSGLLKWNADQTEASLASGKMVANDWNGSGCAVVAELSRSK